ncbi:protein boule-like [Oryzias latipes]|uniref:Boule n=1 Tax=Oryzias latipes TaxID=8090 RepID=C7DLU9_ORYLA|nr:protein boule-like [Oryzias latipes]ACU31026.1 boule [Oryzias latipes]
MDAQNRNRAHSSHSSSSFFSDADRHAHLLMGHAPRTIIPNRIFVGGVDCKVTENHLHHIFSHYGTVTEVKIVTNRSGMSMSKGYGFVTFEAPEDVVNILSKANRICFRDKKFSISQAIQKSQAPGPGSIVHKPFIHHDPTCDTVYLTTPAGFPYTFHNGVAYFNCPAMNQAARQWSPPQSFPQHLQWNAVQVQAPSTAVLYSQQAEFLYQQADGASFLPYLPVMEDAAAQMLEPTVSAVYQGSSALVLQHDPVKSRMLPPPQGHRRSKFRHFISPKKFFHPPESTDVFCTPHPLM